MKENLRELPDNVIWERRKEARRLGFHLIPEKPGYDLIGSHGWAALIDRETEELVCLETKIIDRDGHPWVKMAYPKGRVRQEYVYLGWSA